MLIVYYSIIALAILFMFSGFVMVGRLRRIARGGTVGRAVNIILSLIIFFAVGYLAALYMPRLPQEVNLLLVASVYLFGSIFVVLVLWLIHSLIRNVMHELETERYG